MIISIKNQNKPIFTLSVMFLLIIFSFSTIQSLGVYEIGEDLDQVQGVNTYGYWFDDTEIRWQEFRPLYSTLTRLDLSIGKSGNPGNVLVNITDGVQSLWNTTVLEGDITSTWVNISLESALPLIPEQSYYIYVRSDTDSTSPSDRYHWDGDLNSNYTRGVSSIYVQPSFDFTFVTWSLSNDREVYLDQIQNHDNYGYWFDDMVIRWQEFKPLYSTLTRLDLSIGKSGNPGNILVNITDGNRAIWQTTVLEADIVTGWVNISVDPALPLIPDRSYYIYVGSDTNSPSPSDRYHWDGSTTSNYYRGTSVVTSLPRYDFAFRMWSVPSNTATYLDQVQDEQNYGYWFDDTVFRWQEFKPLYSTLTRLDLSIGKSGNPGNVLVNITDGDQSLWNTTVLEGDITSTWVNISLESALPLIPEQSYYIYVRSDTDSTSPSDRYHWDGHTNSNYTRGVSSISSNPDFDFTFVTWGYSNTLRTYLDQTQEEQDYGYWFDDTEIRWQEFKPYSSPLIQIDLTIQKTGSPGNVLVNISDGQNTLWQGTVLEADIISGWVSMSVYPALSLNPEQSYYIYVGSDTDSPSSSDRYFLRGKRDSRYDRGTSSVEFGNPGFDFTFRTISLFCDRSTYVDQVQDGLNYGYWFEETVIHWQEFVPLYATINQIDLYIQKTGNPGNVLVNITDGQNTLWQGTVLEADVVTGWVSIEISSSLSVIPGQSYFIYVWSDSPSPSVDNRYVWRGYYGSNYYRGASSGVAQDYDFEFRVWGQFLDPLPPEIVITSPTNSDYGTSDIWLSFDINEPTSWIGYSLDDMANVTITENILLSSLSEGSHKIVIYATDLYGNTGESNTVWFTLDTVAPIITIISPMNTTYLTTDIWLNFTIDEPTYAIGYSLDGAGNVTITDNTLLTSLSEGSHRIVIYARDLYGNTGPSDTVWFTVEISEPEPTEPATTLPSQTTLPAITTEPGETTVPTTAEPESTTTSDEGPSISTPGFSVLIVGFAVLLVLIFQRRRY